MQVAARELATQLHCYPISLAAHRLQLCINEGHCCFQEAHRAFQAQQQSYGRVSQEAGDHAGAGTIQEAHSGLSHALEFYLLHGGAATGPSLANCAILLDESVTHRKDRDLDLTSSQWILL